MYTQDQLLSGLDLWLQEHGASHADLATALGVSQPTVTRWVSRSGGIRRSNYPAILKTCAAQLARLAPAAAPVTYPEGSTGAQMLHQANAAALRERPADVAMALGAQQGRRVPLFTEIYCQEHGGLAHIFADVIDKGNYAGDTILVQGSRGDFGFVAAGDSMLPTVCPGDTLLCDSQSNAMYLIGAVCHVVYVDDQGDERRVCKRLREIGEAILFTSDNATFPPLRVPAPQVKFIWEIIEIRRALRRQNGNGHAH